MLEVPSHRPADFRGSTANFSTSRFGAPLTRPLSSQIPSITTLDRIRLRDSKPVHWMGFLPSLELVDLL